MKFTLVNSTILRTIVYTIGHILIAIACIIFITGSDIRLATIDAIVEPLINGVWYFILDHLWNMQTRKKVARI